MGKLLGEPLKAWCKSLMGNDIGRTAGVPCAKALERVRESTRRHLQGKV